MTIGINLSRRPVVTTSYVNINLVAPAEAELSCNSLDGLGATNALLCADTIATVAQEELVRHDEVALCP